VRAEGRGDVGTRLARPHDAGVGACPERQGQRVDQDRLAGAGLTGKHRETGVELDIQGGDDNEVANR